MKIITGASRGIGKFLFEKYLALGEEVYGTYFTTPPGTNSEYLWRVDVSSFSEVNVWIRSLPRSEFMSLINCAGTHYDSFAHKADIYRWERVIQVNLMGTFHTIRAILPIMRANQYGRIINFSSVVARLGGMGSSAYAASKSGLDGLVKVVAEENGAAGITINNLNLGYFDIGMGTFLPLETRISIGKRIPTHQFGKPEGIFNAVNFLIDNPYINGSSISIDGGIS